MSEEQKPQDPTELSPETAKCVPPTPEKEPEPAAPEPECCEATPAAADGSAPCPGPHTAREPDSTTQSPPPEPDSTTEPEPEEPAQPQQPEQ